MQESCHFESNSQLNVNNNETENALNLKTVEGDLFEGLQRTCVAAGRTDRDVSAISQIISFRYVINKI